MTWISIVLTALSTAFLFLSITLLIREREIVLYKTKMKSRLVSMIFLALSLISLLILGPKIGVFYVAIPLSMWLSMMILLILNMITMKKYLAAAPEISSALLEDGKHEALAYTIAEGYSQYGSQLPPRGAYYQKERRSYMKSFDEFNKIDFPENAERLISLQKLVRRNRLICHIIYTLFITWFLQLPVALLSIQINKM